MENIKDKVKNLYNDWKENHHDKFPISISFNEYLDIKIKEESGLSEQNIVEKKFQNKIIPKQNQIYDVILILDKEWEVVQTKGIYKNQWFDEKGEKPISKVIAWR